MTTEERMERAAALKSDMNCCQAVALAFADTVDISEADLMRLGSGFGSGIGTTDGTCGALVGAIMIASLRAGSIPAKQLSCRILPRFRELCGSIVCRELKGTDTGVALCSCEDCVRNAVLATCEAFDETHNH